MLRTRVRPAALLCRGGFLLLFAAFSSPLHSQSVPASSPSAAGLQPSATTSALNNPRAAVDPAAVTLMQQVLSSLGGARAWQAVGAATSNVTVPLPDGTQRKIRWADDWSGSSVLSRRDAVDSMQGSNTVITSGQSQIHSQSSGTQKHYPRDPDLVLLAVGYPGAAILRSLQHPNCTFSSKLTLTGRWPRAQLTQNQDETVVYEQCIEPQYPDGRCDIAWIVSADTATLRGVWLPVRGMLDNSVIYEQVRFTKFHPAGDLLVPSNIAITRPNGRVDTLTVDSPTFTSHLPLSQFVPKKN